MKYVVLLLPVVLLLEGCSPSTEITASWKSPEFRHNSINKILVTTITADDVAGQMIENDFTSALEARGYEATPGLKLLPAQVTPENTIGKDTLLNLIQDQKFDAILTVAVINDQTENRFVPGRYNYDPIQRFEYYRGFTGYFSHRQPTVNTPGYYEEDQVYFLEVNLYNAETEALLWSAQSQTYSPGDLAAVSRDFTSVLLDRMEHEDIITEE